MALEILDVIDTAVKVGLGAAISAFATYRVTHMNHQSDREKALAARRVELLTLTMENLELYFTAFERCCARLGGLLKGGTPAGAFPAETLKRYKTRDSDLLQVRPKRAIAAAHLRLIGMAVAAKQTEDAVTIERRLRDRTIFQKEIPTAEELASIKGEMAALRESIYALMAAAFETNSASTASRKAAL